MKDASTGDTILAYCVVIAFVAVIAWGVLAAWLAIVKEEQRRRK